MMFYIPPALVLGCNTPTDIGVLSDYIEEQTGTTPIFHESGCDDDHLFSTTQLGDGTGNGSGYGRNNGYYYNIDNLDIINNGDGFGCGSGGFGGGGGGNCYTNHGGNSCHDIDCLSNCYGHNKYN